MKNLTPTEKKKGSTRLKFYDITSLILHVRKDVEEQGFVINEQDWYRQISREEAYSRPDVGDSLKFSIRLYRHSVENGVLKEENKTLTIVADHQSSCQFYLTHFIN